MKYEKARASALTQVALMERELAILRRDLENHWVNAAKDSLGIVAEHARRVDVAVTRLHDVVESGNGLIS